MERVASRIVSRMLLANLISDKESDEYTYDVQVLLEKIISYVMILGLAIVFNRLLEIALFTASFSLLRKFSGGIHCKRFETCLIASLIVSYSSILIFPFVRDNYSIYQGGGDNINDNCYFDWLCQQPKYRLELSRISESKTSC